MAKMTFKIEVECEVLTLEEAIAQAGEDQEEIAAIKENAKAFPMPIEILKVTSNGVEIKDEAEDYMEHRHIVAGTGGDGYTLSVTHYIV